MHHMLITRASITFPLLSSGNRQYFPFPLNVFIGDLYLSILPKNWEPLIARGECCAPFVIALGQGSTQVRCELCKPKRCSAGLSLWVCVSSMNFTSLKGRFSLWFSTNSHGLNSYCVLAGETSLTCAKQYILHVPSLHIKSMRQKWAKSRKSPITYVG